jgi:uncharacterized protein with GYD domain
VDFLLLVRRRAPAAALALAAGEKGVEHESEAIERFGGEWVRSSSLLGRYDLAIEVRFPNSDACYAFALAITATGHEVDTMVMIDDAAREKARQLVQEIIETDEATTEES